MLILRDKIGFEKHRRFSSTTASGARLRGKYQHVGLNLFFKTSRFHNSVYKCEEKKLEKS
jgi:hypothetical protein